ncbi:MAG: LytR C-terminal domain-containing protein [Thermodesulfobacteriota bacterium]|nr:LytR C-terminal domain-containing protein [Thermodesulfobacteriota bacterium]
MRLPWAKRQEDNQQDGPDKPTSRFSLQAALIVVLALATLSLVAVGMMKRGNEVNLPAIKVKNRLKSTLTLPAATPPPKTDEAKKDGKPPAASLVKTAQAEKPSATGEKTSKRAAGRVPSQASAEKRSSGDKKAALPASSEASAESEPVQARKKDGLAANVPKPRWQMVDQDWDKVKASPGENIETPNAGWKQLNIGQTEKTRRSIEPGQVVATAQAKKNAELNPRKKVKTPAPARVAPQKTKPGPRPEKTSPRLAIINESGRPANAENLKYVLQAIGYKVAKVEERVPQPGSTTILYGSGLKSKALTLARRIPGRRTLAPLTWKSPYDIVILVR